MRNVLINLMSLQNIDSQLLELEEKRGDLPLRVNRLEQEFKTAESEFNDKKMQIEDYQKEKAGIDIEIMSFQEKKKKYQDQLYEVKNNREYDAITMEIENIKNQINDKETRVLEIMDLEEKLKETIEEDEGKLNEIKENFEKNHDELKKRLAETEKEETALKNQRAALVEKIPPRINIAYDRTRKAKNGQAVVPLYNNACGGCYKNLPPQRVLEIKQMNKMVLCEVCGRILVTDEEMNES